MRTRPRRPLAAHARGALALGACALLATPRFSLANPPEQPARRLAQQRPPTDYVVPAATGAPRITAPPPTAAAPLRAPPLAFDRYRLGNGLEVILHEDHRTPTVAVNIWYHVGGKDEPQGRNGFAHLFEHLMFQGSRHVPEDTFFLNLERIGATGINGTTGEDRTNYFETVPAGRLNLALWLESDRMGFLLDHVDQATFESQRRVVLNERRQSYENAPYGNIWRFLHEALYPPAHPYFRLPIGTPEDLNAASLDDVRNFFRTWYVPNNATLVLAGDFQPAQARQLVEQYFGPIPRGAEVPRRPAPGPVQLPHSKTLLIDAAVQLPRVYLAWPTPAFYAPGDAELDLVGNVLSNGRSSRLYRRMVYDLQIAQDVSASQASAQLGSMFLITVTARPGHTPEELVRVVDEELARLRATPPDAAELMRARTDIETSMVFDIERVAERADRFNRYNQLAGNPDYFARDLSRYQTPAASDLQRTVSTYLPTDRRVVAMVYPAPGAPVSGQLRGAMSSTDAARQQTTAPAQPQPSVAPIQGVRP